MSQILRGWAHSDDLANWDGQGLNENDVPGVWLDLIQDGAKIGQIRLNYNHGWQIELDGGEKPFTVKDIS